MLRSASARPSESVRVVVAKKSMVPTTWPPTMIGRQTPDFTPARWAAGARTQSVTWARSSTKTRSRARQARPERPTPSWKEAARVTCRNSSPALPDSWTKVSARCSASTAQYEP